MQAAEAMKALGKAPQQAAAASSIFGSAATLAQEVETDERLRVSLYPIRYDDMPAVAMGVSACLGYLLEQFESARVFRCFAKIDPADDNELLAEDYQFSPNEWEMEGLAENVLIWGALELGCDRVITASGN